jgi:predicted RNA binding protein YcfA (HicA-like mRNA interferase family)
MSDKLPVLKPKEVVKVLLKVGFVKKRQTGSHLILAKNGKIVPVPIHAKDLKKGVLKSIMKQSELTVKDFTKM